MSELVRIACRYQQPCSALLQSLYVDRGAAGHDGPIADERLCYETVEIGIVGGWVDPGVNRRKIYRLWSLVERSEVDVIAEPRQAQAGLVDHVPDARPTRSEDSDD